jgi:hypothetical protein
MHGADSLGTTPKTVLHFKCDVCGRKGSYRVTTMIAEFGPDVMMPELTRMVARWRGRPKVALADDLGGSLWNACGVKYDLEKR